MSEQKTTADLRAEYIAGLRALADVLEANPVLQLPYHGKSHIPMTVSLGFQAGQREQLAAWTRAIPGHKTKDVDDERFAVLGAFRGLHIRVSANRDEVCEKVVIGTREVTETVPDPKRLARVPLVEVTKLVEDVEWVCIPVLAEDVAHA